MNEEDYERLLEMEQDYIDDDIEDEADDYFPHQEDVDK